MFRLMAESYKKRGDRRHAAEYKKKSREGISEEQPFLLFYMELLSINYFSA